MSGGELRIWTIYDHPLDWPEFYVAREFAIGLRDDTGPVPVMRRDAEPTDNLMMARNLDELRATMRFHGLTVIPRDESDDAGIVESWL